MVQIITDSSTLYTIEEAKKAGFEAVPLCVSVGDLEGRDMHIDMDEFYKRIKMGQVPMSSQPPIGDVLDVFEAYKDENGIDADVIVGAKTKDLLILEEEMKAVAGNLSGNQQEY